MCGIHKSLVVYIGQLTKGLVMWSFDVFFVASLKKLLNGQLAGNLRCQKLMLHGLDHGLASRLVTSYCLNLMIQFNDAYMRCWSQWVITWILLCFYDFHLTWTGTKWNNSLKTLLSYKFMFSPVNMRYMSSLRPCTLINPIFLTYLLVNMI